MNLAARLRLCFIFVNIGTELHDSTSARNQFRYSSYEVGRIRLEQL